MLDNNTYCVIMAGGEGCRLWPLSQPSFPKQFMDLLGTGKSFLRQSFERFEGLLPVERIFVITERKFTSIVESQIPELPQNNIIVEPEQRDTAICVAYASYRIQAINPNAKLIIAPSDHLITNTTEFKKVVASCVEFIDNKDILLTIGIKPHYAEIGYGYIQTTAINQFENHSPNFYKAKTFTEKPDLEVAKILLESGDFYWNSGIFIWSVSSIISALERFMPNTVELFQEGETFFNTDQEQNFVEHLYKLCRKISIDYAVMEKAENVYVCIADFGWADIGTWNSLHSHSSQDLNNNVIIGGQVHSFDVKNSLVSLPIGTTAIIEGLDNYIVAVEGNAILVCRRSENEQIKKYIMDIRLKQKSNSF